MSNSVSVKIKLGGFINLLRPKQWLKNLFVFGAAIFAEEIFKIESFSLVILAAISFSLISSCVYIMNDFLDVEKDKMHPKKKFRPIAAGMISKSEAIIALAILFPLVCISTYFLNKLLLVVILIYFLNNIIYSSYIKNKVILDVMSIAIGFVLRVVGGAFVINVPISPWILLCTFLLATFLGFNKRRNELTVLENESENHRTILKEYSVELIDNMLGIISSATLMAYSLYTFSSRDDFYLMLTIPYVMYGIFRYQYLVHKKNQGGSPEEVLLNDIPLAINILLWGGTSVAVLYFV